jgi:hypothetical protein
VWQGGYFEEGSYVVLGKSFRRAKVAGSYGLGRNYIMMRLKEVGEIPKDQVAIRRMVQFRNEKTDTPQHHLKFYLIVIPLLDHFLSNIVQNNAIQM